MFNHSDILGKIENHQNQLANYHFGTTNGGGAGSYVVVTLPSPINGRNIIEAYCVDPIPPGDCFVYKVSDDRWEVKSSNTSNQIRSSEYMNVRRRPEGNSVCKWAAAFVVENNEVTFPNGNLILQTTSYTVYYREDRKKPITVFSINGDARSGGNYVSSNFTGKIWLNIISKTETILEYSALINLPFIPGQQTVRTQTLRFLIKNGTTVESLPGFSSDVFVGQDGQLTIDKPFNQNLNNQYKKYFVNRNAYLNPIEQNVYRSSFVAEIHFGEALRYLNYSPVPPFNPPPEGKYWRILGENETVLRGKSYISALRTAPNDGIRQLLNNYGLELPSDNVFPSGISIGVRKSTSTEDVGIKLIDSSGTVYAFGATFPGFEVADGEAVQNIIPLERDQTLEVWELGDTIEASEWEKTVTTNFSGGIIQTRPGIDYQNWKTTLRAKKVGQVKVDLTKKGLTEGLGFSEGSGFGSLDLVFRLFSSTYKVAYFE